MDCECSRERKLNWVVGVFFYFLLVLKLRNLETERVEFGLFFFMFFYVLVFFFFLGWAVNWAQIW